MCSTYGGAQRQGAIQVWPLCCQKQKPGPGKGEKEGNWASLSELPIFSPLLQTGELLRGWPVLQLEIAPQPWDDGGGGGGNDLSILLTGSQFAFVFNAPYVSESSFNLLAPNSRRSWKDFPAGMLTGSMRTWGFGLFWFFEVLVLTM